MHFALTIHSCLECSYCLVIRIQDSWQTRVAFSTTRVFGRCYNTTNNNSIKHIWSRSALFLPILIQLVKFFIVPVLTYDFAKGRRRSKRKEKEPSSTSITILFLIYLGQWNVITYAIFYKINSNNERSF